MGYWLVKSPFKSRTWARVVAAGQFHLYGIRNAQARQSIAKMKPDDLVLFYFQQKVWGVMQVTAEPIPDPTSADEGRKTGPWLSVTFTPSRTIEPPITLSAIKVNSAFQDSSLLRQPRLSVVALTDNQWQSVVP
jgi:predicted RNA-binding protein with PUA-like domain